MFLMQKDNVGIFEYPYIVIECTFILTHFSMKYRADEIIEYFKNERLTNVVVQTMKGFIDYGCDSFSVSCSKIDIAV